jgi:hypothetical protein
MKNCKVTYPSYQIRSYGLFHLRITMEYEFCGCPCDVAEDSNFMRSSTPSIACP